LKQDFDKGLTITEIAAAHNSSLSAIYRFRDEYLDRKKLNEEISEFKAKAIYNTSNQERLDCPRVNLKTTNDCEVIVKPTILNRFLSFLGFNDAKREQKL
jgi:hypothetical protein